MRAAFCGKGGSGKTSIASLFTRFVVDQGIETLAIDGDINQHLGEALFLPDTDLATLPRLGEELETMQSYLRGANQRIQDASQIIESTPAGRGSNFIRLDNQDPVSQRFMMTQNNLRFIAMGGHGESDVGATCYHKFTGALGTFLNHLLDNEDEMVIADMCAGADPFASSGLASRFDTLFLICEPTKKSLAVFDQAVHYSQYHDLTLCVIGNKIENTEDEDFIKSYVKDYYLTRFHVQSAFKKAERGQSYTLNDLDADTRQSLQIMLTKAQTNKQRDWKKYQRTGMFFHERAAASWASATYGSDLTLQHDPEFDYNDAYASQQKAA